MKKYLFDKIEVLGEGVKFIPFRKANIIESFSAFTNMTFNQEEWEFKPTSLKEFLKMLEKTRLDSTDEYQIYAGSSNRSEIEFDELLQGYATDYYSDKPVNEEELAEFYIAAYNIRNAAIENRKLLDVNPADFSKQA